MRLLIISSSGDRYLGGILRTESERFLILIGCSSYLWLFFILDSLVCFSLICHYYSLSYVVYIGIICAFGIIIIITSQSIELRKGLGTT